MAGIKIVDLPAVGRDLAATDLFEMSLVGGTGSRKITGQEIMNASKLSANNTPVINGTSGRIFFQDAANVLQQSANLFWDNTNNSLGIGTTSPATTLQVNGNAFLNGGSYTREHTIYGRIKFSTSSTSTRLALIYGDTTGLYFFTNNYTNAVTLTNSTGNFLINTTTDAGFKLDVNGTARVQTSMMVGTQTANSSGVKLETDGVFRAWTRIDLGQFGATSLTSSQLQYNISGSNGYLITNATSHTATTGTYYAVRLQNNIAPTSGTGVFNLLDIVSTINQTGGANGITRGLYINPTLTAAADFRAIETTAGNVLFGTGFFWDNTNARLGIGTSTPTTKINIVTPNNGDALRLEVPSTNSTVYDFYLGNLDNSSYIRANTRILELRRQGASSIIRTVGGVLNDLALQADGGITLSTYGANEKMRIVGSTGNVLINTTTDAGFRLDVNGTARVLGDLTIGTLGSNNVISFGGGVNTTIFRDLGDNSLNFRNAFSATVVHRFRTNSDLPNANTSGNNVFLSLPIGFAPTSGTGTWAQLSMTPTINQTGTASGAVRGIYYNPTLTSVLGIHYAIHTTSGRVRLEGLPTSPTGLSAGDLWNNGGVINIV